MGEVNSQETTKSSKGSKKNKDNKSMSMSQSLAYTVKLIWQADKGCVIYNFFKNCTEEVFHAFFMVYMIKQIYSYIEQDAPFHQLAKVIIIFCLIHILIHFSSAGYAYYIRLKTPKVYRHIFLKVIDKSLTIDLTKFEQPQFYDQYSRALDECLTKAMDSLFHLTMSIACILSSISLIGIIASVDPWLLIFILPPILGFFLLSSKQNQAELALREEETKDKRMMEYVKRVFYEKKYASELRLYSIRNLLFRKHRDSYENRYEINAKYRKKIALYMILQMVVFMGISTLSSHIYVAYVLKSNLKDDLGSYVAILSAILYLTWTIGDAIDSSINAGKYAMYMNNLKSFLDCKVSGASTHHEPIEGALGDIVFDHVTFTYEGSTSPVINDLSMTIKKGERIALVGENGAGKTTLIKLLMGLYPINKGNIYASGKNINTYTPKEYHKHFGAVFQDLQIFALPISHNVLMREPSNEEERTLVKDALIKAQFGDKLEELSNGIDTMLSKEFDDDGFVCSGGQAQKIAIARIFAKNPDIVILDEPSSALDPIAEYNMYRNMMEVSEDKTVFFISHRLSSARIADKIYFLEQGQIKEMGTHDELIRQNGTYAQMFHLQAQNYRKSLTKDRAAEMEVLFDVK